MNACSSLSHPDSPHPQRDDWGTFAVAWRRMAPLQVTHERTYSCAACRTHLATHDQLVSKSFQVLAERAWHAFPPLCTHQGCTCTHMQQSAAVLHASRLAHSIGTGAAGARLPLLGCRERILRPVRIAVCKRCSIEVQSRSAPLAAQSASWVANDRDRAAVLACYACDSICRTPLATPLQTFVQPSQLIFRLSNRKPRPEERLLMSGVHVVCDIFCISCNTRLGWR